MLFCWMRLCSAEVSGVIHQVRGSPSPSTSSNTCAANSLWKVCCSRSGMMRGPASRTSLCLGNVPQTPPPCISSTRANRQVERPDGSCRNSWVPVKVIDRGREKGKMQATTFVYPIVSEPIYLKNKGTL
ncbi:hypothetical protein L207DRAFT_231702 [Hyaloscypha variabilis F]|uniref:Uncharacterized protein n=1 Tax=Hyaloscypha variabilis (strain UAMH 11265 / GT02V1 / F) TaxID=1149755 RepID=A0A2J6QUD9_HYAVF|nr:hypothetical protein L207DRAFT_231702 [Hyaloscypha variabilis F]